MQEPDLIIELDIVLLQVVHLAREDTQLVLYVAPGWTGDESSSSFLSLNLSLSLNNGHGNIHAGLSFKHHLNSVNLECFFKYISSPCTALGGDGLHPHLAD